MADYLSRFPSAGAPETSYYDENFTVAKALYPRDQLKPRGHLVHQIQIPTVEGVRSCAHSNESVASNKSSKKLEYANASQTSMRSLEGVVACNRRPAN